MGGGDLNMKKSWHPLLLKNQERVWLEEKKALEEKKKLDQLRKEKEEERQLQELQRLQEEQTGKKRTEKLEWMYTTPATGTSQNPNDLEDYLLGKKRVDKILTADENAKVGAAHKNFIAVQNANNARDIAAKIREDPLLAIKQQEQAAYQALISNPLRLREMQERNGIKPKKDKEARKREKEEHKRLKHERKYQKARESRSPSPARYHSDHRSPSRDRYSRSRRSSSPHDRRSRSPTRPRYDDWRYGRSREYSPRRSPSPYHGRDNHSARKNSRPSRSDRNLARWPGSDDSEDNYTGGSGLRRNLNQHPDRGKRPLSRSPDRARTPPYKRTRVSVSPHHQATSRSHDLPRKLHDQTGDRAARIAAMSIDASSMSVERQERLVKRLEEEKAELAAEEHARQKSKGVGGFLSQEQKKVFGGSDLADRIKRGRGGMLVDAD